jgi:hypothetical protein
LLDRISLKTIASIATLVTLAALIVGFMLDAKGFAGNLLAEVAGVLVSVLLAIFIVEKLVERERSRRWDLVSAETTTTLRFAVIRAGHHLYLRLPSPRPAAADPYTLGLFGENRLAGALRLLAERIEETPDLGTGEDLVAAVRPHLELMRGGVMPQLLAIGEHDLIARLAALESAFQELEHTVWLQDRLGQLRQFHPAAAALVNALAEVSESIDGAGPP